MNKKNWNGLLKNDCLFLKLNLFIAIRDSFALEYEDVILFADVSSD